MQILQFGRYSRAYHKLMHSTFAAEHAHLYLHHDEMVQQRMMRMRTPKNEFDQLVFNEKNLFHLDRLTAKDLIERRYCLDLKSFCAQREMLWRDQLITLSGCIDGLDGGLSGGELWVHIPYTPHKHNVIALCGWSEYLDRSTRLYIEHLLLLCQSDNALLSLSDGTFANTMSYQYKTDMRTRIALLYQYSEMQAQINAINSRKKSIFRNDKF